MRKINWLLTLAVVLALAPVAWTQEKIERPDAAPSKGTPASKKAAPDQDQKGANVRARTKISAELVSSLDVRTAKPGDEVVAKVTKNVKQDGRVAIHKGDRLLGRVASAEASSSANASSQLAVTFDRLQQGETVTPLNAVISQFVGASAATSESASEMGSVPAMGSAPMGSRAGGGSHGGGGGLVGGATSTVGGATSTLGQTANSTVGTTGSAVQGVGNAGANVGASTQTSAGANGTSGLPTPVGNIHLASSAQASNQNQATSTLSTKKGGLLVNSGTRMEFRVTGQAEADKKGKQ